MACLGWLPLWALTVSSHSLFLLVGDLKLEADGPAEPQPEMEDFLTVTAGDDRFEVLEPEAVHEGRTPLFKNS